jgi:hypothetical protein
MRRLVLLTIAVAMGITGCATGTPTPPGPSGTATGSSTGTGSATASPTSSGWSSSPVTVTRTVAVPPVPQLTAIRSAQHSADGYDRVVFDFVSVLPGYDVRYVDSVTTEGTGVPVTVPGRRYLKVTFRPAQAHDDAGVGIARSATLDLPMLKAYAITGDFEGVLTVALGLDDDAGFRIIELPGGPGRIAIDVAS